VSMVIMLFWFVSHEIPNKNIMDRITVIFVI
jgi:hypothetical protein